MSNLCALCKKFRLIRAECGTRDREIRIQRWTISKKYETEIDLNRRRRRKKSCFIAHGTSNGAERLSAPWRVTTDAVHVINMFLYKGNLKNKV